VVETASSGPPRIGFVLEQTLGHITHAANLRTLVSADAAVDAAFAEVAYDVTGAAALIPGYGNWTVRSGIRARRAIAGMRRGGPLDALFVHTQVPAIMLPDIMRRTPTVVSLDATPIQYDELGLEYGHATGGPRVEHLKWQANWDCFARAELIVAWAEWTKTGLVNRYGVPADNVVVIPPGVDCARWAAVRPATDGDLDRSASVRVLFVGGDLARKGGLDLIAAVVALRREGVAIELDVVTRDDAPSVEGVRIHHGLGPNSPALIDLYHAADVFCLPTHGDCLPMVLSEAGAVGLPLVSTDIGAISEIVRDGETGLLVPVGDTGALAATLGRLAADPELRRRLGAEAQRVVRSDFDAVKNAHRLVELLVEVARPAGGATRAGRRRPVLLTVSGTIAPDVREAIAEGRRPRADYLEMAEAFDAEVLDRAGARAETGRLGRIVERAAGSDALLAWACYRRRKQHRVVFTDGEQVGLPYAVLTSLARRRPRHVMIGHLLSARKKVLLHRLLRLQRRIDAVVVYAGTQRDVAIDVLGYPPDHVVLHPFMVDTGFWRPELAETAGRTRPMICAVGQELRDYPTLVEAVRGLDVDVVVAAASPWSKREDSSAGLDVPPNVEVDAFDLFRLRQLYTDAAFVVVPLQETDFQAGITTILEAMAMGRAVVCTRTTGQTDTLVDDVTGIYVPPGDVGALRTAVQRLLDDPATAARIGAAGQAWVRANADIVGYARDLSALTRAD
jgi:glycosyltransferase involved in cell wall biosynthesis